MHLIVLMSSRSRKRNSSAVLKPELSFSPRQTPRILWIEAIVQRLDLFLAFLLGDLIWIGCLLKIRSQLHQPLGINHHDVSHVFLGGQHQFMVHDVFGILLKERRGGVNVYRILVH